MRGLPWPRAVASRGREARRLERSKAANPEPRAIRRHRSSQALRWLPPRAARGCQAGKLEGSGECAFSACRVKPKSLFSAERRKAFMPYVSRLAFGRPARGAKVLCRYMRPMPQSGKIPVCRQLLRNGLRRLPHAPGSSHQPHGVQQSLDRNLLQFESPGAGPLTFAPAVSRPGGQEESS